MKFQHQYKLPEGVIPKIAVTVVISQDGQIFVVKDGLSLAGAASILAAGIQTVAALIEHESRTAAPPGPPIEKPDFDFRKKILDN